MKGQKHQHSIRLSLHTVLLLISVGLALLFVFVELLQFYSTTSDYLRSSNASLEETKFSRAKTEISENLTQLETIARLAVSDPQIQELLESTTEKTYYINIQLQKSLRQLLYKGGLIQPQVDSIFILTDYGAYWSGDLVPSSTQKDRFLAQFHMGERQWHFPESASEPAEPGAALPTLTNRVFYVLPFTVHTENDSCVCVVAQGNFLQTILTQDLPVGVLSPSGAVLLNRTSFSNEALQESEIAPALRSAELSGDLMLLFETKDNSQSVSWRQLQLLIFVLVPAVFLLAFILSAFLSRPLVQPLKNFSRQLTASQAGQEISLLRDYPLSVHEWILLTLLITVSVCCLLVSTISIRFFGSVSSAAFQSSSEEFFQQAVDSTENFFKNHYSTTLHFGFNDSLRKLLASGSGEDTGEDADSGLSEYLERAKSYFLYTTQLTLYQPDGTLLASTDPVRLGTMSLSQLPKQGTPDWYAERQSGGWTISLLWRINNIATMQPLGYFLAQVDESDLSAIYDYFRPGFGEIYLHLQDGTVLSSTNKLLIGQKAPAAMSEELCLSQSIDNTPLTLTVVLDNSLVRSQQQTMKLKMLYSLLLTLVLALIASLLLSHYLSKHLSRSFRQISGLAPIDPEPFSPESTIISEIEEMNRAFADMAQYIQELSRQTAESERRQKELELAQQRARFAMLQAQINPHFLYNSFETISALIRQKETDTAADMLCGISSMLRYALRTDASLVALTEEVQYAKTYMDIMQRRHSGLLQATFDFTEDAMRQRVIRFILQPILENAVNHGLRPRDGQGNICVMGKIADGKLLISIRDDGVGMDKAQVAALRKSLNREPRQDGHHIGLSNIHHRLRTYGESYGVQIISHPNSGTIVIIQHPLLP